MNQEPPTLFKNPFQTLHIFIRVISSDIKNVITNHKALFTLLFLVISIYSFLHLFELSFLELSDRVIIFLLFWIGLGVLSSIGLGTGLHTFILYLGPKVARFVMASYQCNKIVQMTPHRFSLDPQFHCSNQGNEVSFWNLFSVIFLEGFLWGFGTALGELPPYIVSKTAALRGEELEEEETGFLQKSKEKIFKHIKEHSFITVLLLASIPNPLFDLAGLICGHLQISFWTFFLATAIGKSLIKVNLQLVSIIFLFSKQTLNLLQELVKQYFPYEIGQQIDSIIQKQQKKLIESQDTQEESWVGVVWNLFLFLIIGSFVVSIINSKVRNQQKSKLN